MLETTGSRAIDTAIAVAVDACYDHDGDRKRNSIRYFAPPEEYVALTYEVFKEAGLLKDSAD